MVKSHVTRLATLLLLVAAMLGGCSSAPGASPPINPATTQADALKAQVESAKEAYRTVFTSINADLQESLPIIVDTLANHMDKFFSGDSALLTKAGTAAGPVQACYVRAKALTAPPGYETGHMLWLKALGHFDKAMTYFLQGKRSAMPKCAEQISLGDKDLGEASSAFE